MIENYKGWVISLNWNDKVSFENDNMQNTIYKKKEKWSGVNLHGNRIYGSSLKEIRHIIDYPGLYE